MAWLEENGADMSGLYLKKYTDEVRGVHADRPIAASSQIVTIPVKLLIHEGMGQKTSVGSRVHNDPTCHIIVPAHTQVIIYILEHLNDSECFFKPYFDILPSTFNSFPIFFTEEEMSWLEGSDLVRQIEDRKANIAADYNAVCRCCPDFAERHTLEDFLWCRTAVGSRNFGITINGVKRTTMVPFSDMLNHYRPRETSWTFDDSQQSFTMTSLAGIATGQQVMDSYGKKCNSKFLLHYGFAIETNREEDGRCQNEIFIEFKMPDKETDPHHNHRLQLAGPTLSIRCMMTFDEKRTQEAFSYCRLAVANQEELADIQVRHLDTRTFFVEE
jgi:histone-lysine N-methyltransferase SETD3